MKNVERITSTPDVMNGRPVIRNMRFSVGQMLELLASGMKSDEILADYPFLELEDIQACLKYAALITNTGLVTRIGA